MQITLTLNDEKTVISASADQTLLAVLRREKLFSVKCGCEKGFCGNCMVLLDGEPAPSCLLRIGMLHERNVETLEHFSKSPLYDDITQGFEKAGLKLCGYCSSGKYFMAYSILKKYQNPDVQKIRLAVSGMDLCCVDRDSFINGIIYSFSARLAREGKKTNA